jgi:hypothetical protein
VYLAQDDDGNFSNGGTTFLPLTKVGTGATLAYELNVDLTNALPYLRFAVLQDTADTDVDGVINVNDIDDDNDGVPDETENGDCAGIFNFSAIGTTAASYTINGTTVTQSSSAAAIAGSDAAGNLALANAATATLVFSKPTVLRISHATNTTVSFSSEDKLKLSSLGTVFQVSDRLSNLTINNKLDSLVMPPIMMQNPGPSLPLLSPRSILPILHQQPSFWI